MPVINSNANVTNNEIDNSPSICSPVPIVESDQPPSFLPSSSNLDNCFIVPAGLGPGYRVCDCNVLTFLRQMALRSLCVSSSFKTFVSSYQANQETSGTRNTELNRTNSY